MKIIINKNILKKTKECNKKFCCLKSQKNICEIDECISKKIYFINCKNNPHCNYVRSFGDANYCTCPTRMVIYNKYGKMEINMGRTYDTTIMN